LSVCLAAAIWAIPVGGELAAKPESTPEEGVGSASSATSDLIAEVSSPCVLGVWCVRDEIQGSEPLRYHFNRMRRHRRSCTEIKPSWGMLLRSWSGYKPSGAGSLITRAGRSGADSSSSPS
jgi:hypothetical protein